MDELSEEALQRFEMALIEGRRLDAIQVFKSETGVNLQQAWDATITEAERLFTLGILPYDPSNHVDPLGDAILEAVCRSRIEAIKIYRDATGHGLPEAQRFIESLLDPQPIAFSKKLVRQLMRKGDEVALIRLFDEHPRELIATPAEYEGTLCTRLLDAVWPSSHLIR